MNNPDTVLNDEMFINSQVNMVNVFTGTDMTVDAFYFSPNQTLPYNNPKESDQCFVFIKGNGKFFLNNGSESTINITDGAIIYVPSGVSYKIESLDNRMVAVQSSKAINSN